MSLVIERKPLRQERRRKLPAHVYVLLFLGSVLILAGQCLQMLADTQCGEAGFAPPLRETPMENGRTTETRCRDKSVNLGRHDRLIPNTLSRKNYETFHGNYIHLPLHAE